MMSVKPGDIIEASEVDNDEILSRPEKLQQSSEKFVDDKRISRKTEKIDLARLSAQYLSN